MRGLSIDGKRETAWWRFGEIRSGYQQVKEWQRSVQLLFDGQHDVRVLSIQDIQKQGIWSIFIVPDDNNIIDVSLV